MDEDEVRRVETQEEIASRIEALADTLARLASSRTAEQYDRRAAALYEPFLRILSKTPKFCSSLVSLPLDEYSSSSDIRSEFQSLLVEFRLPHRGGFEVTHWVNLLWRALLEVEGAAPVPFHEIFEWAHDIPLELHFLSPPTGRVVNVLFPIEEVAVVDWPRMQTHAEYKRMLMMPVKTLLSSFRRRLGSRLGRRSSFEVRLMTLGVDPSRGALVHIAQSSTHPESWISRSFSTTIVDNFTVKAAPGRRIELARNVVVDEILSVLTNKGLLLEHRGRVTDSESLAAQWQMVTLDNLTHEEVAAREGLVGDAVLDRAEGLARRFRRFGIE